MARRTGGTRPCDATEARQRLAKASECLDAGTSLEGDYPTAASTLCIQAGILAADALCCAVLGRRSNSPSHADAVVHLRSIAGRRRDLAAAPKALERLLAHKDRAEYTPRPVAATALRTLSRAAADLVELARSELH